MQKKKAAPMTTQLSFYTDNKPMKVKIKDGLLIREVAGEHVLIDAGGGVDFSKMLMLNETAVSVINLLRQGVRTEEELAHALAEEYEVAEETALQDVRELLGQLREQGLVSQE